VLGIVVAAVYDRLVVKKQQTTYTITGFAHSGKYDFEQRG